MADLAVAGRGIGAEPRWGLRLLAPIPAALAAEGDRRVLWLPVFFGGGIALYFTLTIEPPLWLGLAGAAPAILVVALLWRRPTWRDAAISLAFVAAGFAVIQQARVERGTPMLERRLGPVAITGTVIDIDALDRGWRIIVAPDPLPVIASQPHRLRIHIAATSDPLQPGDRVSLKAKLYPVPAQVLPGGRDMQRELYFAGIGGVGYSFGAAHREGAAETGGWRQWLLQLRAEMTRRINAALPGSTGGVASAVITGNNGAPLRIIATQLVVTYIWSVANLRVLA